MAKLVLPLLLICAVDFCASKAMRPSDVTVQPGEDVILPCRGPGGADITVIEWTRTDLGSDRYVFFYPQNPSNKNFQLPSFRGRVELTDPEVRDASVVLKNVTFNDTGTYECRVKERNTRHRKRDAPEPTSIIKLTVGEGGHEDGGHKEGGHEEGGHKEGGHEDGGHKEGGHKDGGHKEGGHEDGGHKEGGLEEGGHKEGGLEEGGHKEGGHTGGSVGLIVSLSVIAVLVVGVVGFVTFRIRRRSEPTSYQPPADEIIDAHL